MEITALDVFPVRLDVTPLEDGGIAPYVTRYTEFWDMERVLIRLTTTDGVTGWGEMRSTLSVDSTKTILENELAPEVIGRPVSSVESLRVAFDHYQYFDIDPFVGGVEMAMWDAYGKSLGVPVADLLGGNVDDGVEFASCLGILEPEASRTYAARASEEGFSVLKTKAGRDWRTDVERIVAMDDEVDGELEFRLDPNEGWTVEDAVRVGAALEDAGVYLQYLEQPIRIDTFGTYQRLRERLRTPIAVNEDTYFRHNLLELVKRDAIDVGVIDLVPAGGLLAAKELAGLADDAGISLSHHCAFDLGIKTAAILALVATTPAINLPVDSVYYSWEDHIIETPFEFDGGRLFIRDRPGLGVTVDEEQVEAYRID
ncbi:mandelate racemase/muconate lactonizing enzyme family protein [Natronobiforma cellulositropha]|uniref:mandelate racemase/muconate lactonizing enzyme family protein n=1 Tax=Natronobiforma cellulositropha TaxID=1679076 RepID=UPI0021D5E1BA|nr:mandelate racemase/muconate lactonizing enzyme family protein [Natronobiforma cellulositropha]